MRDYFVHSLPNDYQKFILATNSQKIEDALNAALLFEGMKTRPDQKYYNKGVTHSNKGTEKSVVKSDEDKADNNANNTDKKNVECHFCHKKGHYARDCYKKKAFMEKKSQNVDSVSSKFFLTLQVGDVIEELLLDTGASVSLLPDSRFVPNSESNADFSLADGCKMSASGHMELPVRTLEGDLLLNHNFYAAPVTKCYIGTDILEKIGAVVDLHKQIVTTSHGSVIPLCAASSYVGQQCPVVAALDLENDAQFLTDEVPDPPDVTGVCVDEEGKLKIEELVNSYDGLFSGIGKTNMVKHYINTTDNVLSDHKVRRI